MCLFKQNAYSDARHYFSSILEKIEDQQELADAWLNIACAYRLESDLVNAELALSKSKVLAPDDSSILEEEQQLMESKLQAVYLRAHQTLFNKVLPLLNQNTIVINPTP